MPRPTGAPTPRPSPKPTPAPSPSPGNPTAQPVVAPTAAPTCRRVDDDDVPKLKEARFTFTGGQVNLVLTKASDRGAVSGFVASGDDCAKLFEGFTDDEQCAFLNAREVQATPASALDIGAEVRLKADVLTAEDACEPTNDRGEVVEIEEPEDAQPLTMAMVAPAEIGTCRELVLEGVAEGGTAGRPVTWVWDSSEDFEFTATSEVRLGDAALAPHYGSTISFKCCATNWLGDEACVTQKVEVLDEPAPSVVVEEAWLPTTINGTIPTSPGRLVTL